MRNSPVKQLILFLIGSVLNVALFCLSKYLGFPLWLDFTGSLYITAVCGPFLGGFSLLLHSAVLAALIDGVCALWLIIPAVFACAVIYLSKRFELFKTPLGYVCSMFLTALSAAAGYFTIFIINFNPPARYDVYSDALSSVMRSHGVFLGTVISSIAIAFAEFIPCLALFSAAYFLTPRPKSSLSFKK